MELLGSAKNKTIKHKNDQNMPHFETPESLPMLSCSNSRMLFTFICSKLFGQLLDTSLKFTLIQSFIH